MVFGKADIDVRRNDDDLTAEICGLDVHDPTTEADPNHSVDDIATWSIDTDCDGSLFRVGISHPTSLGRSVGRRCPT
jgi:hypothetical protein